jgi:RimJ/RimL family protein N-acetyltransferase
VGSSSTWLRYTEGYREKVVLADGTWAELRCIGAQEAWLLQDVFAGLSARSRMNRFHTTKHTLTPAELRYFAHVDGLHHFALGAVALEGPLAGRGIGVARFVRLQDRVEMAEAAFSVVDAAQGKRLGRVLLGRLMEAARERGVKRLECNVLPANAPMRRLLAPLGPTRRIEVDGTLLFDVPLAPAVERRPEAWHTGEQAGV